MHLVERAITGDSGWGGVRDKGRGRGKGDGHVAGKVQQ